ncbi:MAG: hypothetical protein HZB54_02050 [Deltaproteobacteria bacterium]|nr:hypothetical protein [Deltaproteobacteria bacterium]
MRERDRDIRRRRHRREKAKKAKIRALIAQSKSGQKKKPAEAVQEVKEEKKVIHRKPAVKIVKPAKEASGVGKKGES